MRNKKLTGGNSFAVGKFLLGNPLMPILLTLCMYKRSPKNSNVVTEYGLERQLGPCITSKESGRGDSPSETIDTEMREDQNQKDYEIRSKF